jgi:hypothetical protein
VPFDRQQAFDMAASGVLTQRRPSRDDEGVCRYRTRCHDRSLKCTIGWLIPDYRYKEHYENHESFPFAVVARQGLAPHLGFDGCPEDLSFLEALRFVHDAASGATTMGTAEIFLAEFVDRMEQLGRRYSLDVTALNGRTPPSRIVDPDQHMLPGFAPVTKPLSVLFSQWTERRGGDR